jgi:hypothetical protein
MNKKEQLMRELMEEAEDKVWRDLEKRGLNPDFSCIGEHDWRIYELTEQYASVFGDKLFVKYDTICKHCGAAGSYLHELKLTDAAMIYIDTSWCEGYDPEDLPSTVTEQEE